MNYKQMTLSKNYDPFNIAALFNEDKDFIFLDSAKGDSPYSKYSFIGINPIWRFTSQGTSCFLNDKPIPEENDPFSALERLLAPYKMAYNSPFPFIGGVVGYFAYDIARVLEKLPSTATTELSIPDSYFVLYDNIIIFDLENKTTTITALGVLDEAENTIKNITRRIENSRDTLQNTLSFSPKVFTSNFNQIQYEKTITKMRNYMEEGHIYIANMTRHMYCDNPENGFDLYKGLRENNAAPFAAYMRLNDFEVLCSSPERFIQIKNGLVETRPIKGTTPRGSTKKEDEKYRQKLIDSQKDRSELLMVVDLERNDLSKVCKPHSVKVTELFKIEEYATVFHLVCTIVGTLKENTSPVQCMRSCFPGGSITGTPKIRAMEIIEELEGLRRGLYTGCIGYFDLRGNADFNIVIRTIVKKDGKSSFGIGGGITWESDETSEWLETIDKGVALMRILSCEHLK